MFWDIFDNLAGPLNLINRAGGFLRINTRQGSRRYRGRHGVNATVRLSHPRADKAPGYATFMALQAHMRRYGVELYGPTHDATLFHFSVAKRQAGWYRRLYGDGKSLWSPRRAWADKVRRWW